MRHRASLHLSRPIVDRFWSPFKQTTTAGHLPGDMQRVLEELTTPRNFSCLVNGVLGHSPTLIEDFFVVVLTGFDVEGVKVDKLSEQRCMAEGRMTLQHQRTFLGWAATGQQIEVPYHLSMEGCVNGARASHITLRTGFVPALEQAGCPSNVIDCMAKPEATKMLVALRRAKVRPELISVRALQSATKQQDKWRSALDLL